MRLLNLYITALLILTSCLQSNHRESVMQQQTGKTSDTSIHVKEKTKNAGHISILNNGPRGGAYQSSNGDNFRYTVFRVQILNDTIIPIKLDLNFPNHPIRFLPDSTLVCEVFLVPEKFAPNSIQDVFNFGTRLEALFESGQGYQYNLTKTIQPNNRHTLYVVVLIKNNIVNGVTRAKLFAEGQDHDAPFFKVESEKRYNLNSEPIYLVYGISIDPPNYGAFIRCGQVYLEK